MSHATRCLLTAGLVVVGGVHLAGCSNDPDPLGSGDEYSVYDALGELPSSVGEENGPVFTGDLTRAGELAGLEPPSDPDDEAAGDWVLGLNGRSDGEDPAQAFVPMPPTLTGGSPTEMEEQVGWSVVDVDSFAATSDFLVASGGFDDDTLEEDLAKVEGDIVTDIEGEDHEEHPDRPTAFDYQGTPTRLAHDDGRIAASSETDAVREWLDDEESLADDDAYADVAKALDDEDAYSALLLPMTAGKESYDLVGIGWSEDDGAPLVTTAFHFESEDAARGSVDELRDRFDLEPVGEHLEVEGADTNGSSVVVTTRPEEGAIDVLMRAVVSFGPPFNVG
jgi:hypothetical protein